MDQRDTSIIQLKKKEKDKMLLLTRHAKILGDLGARNQPNAF